MKTILFAIVCSLYLGFCNLKAEQQKTEVKKISLLSDTINYQAQIQPILQKNCSPCHFVGGKMYAKMPFDKAETIVSHEDGILKRIKKEEENKLIRQFILQRKG